MNRLRGQERPDSLELLLDTMCNTFGGIILIALLIALLSRDSSSSARIENTREQIEQVARQTTEAEKLQKRLLAQSDTNAAAVIALLTERDDLKKQIESQRQAAESNTLKQASITATNDPIEAEKLAARLQERTKESASLQQQIQKENQSRQRQLRLPRERVTGKKTFYFVMQFGRIYPVTLMQDGQRTPNRQMLDWSSTADGETVAPRRDSGLDLPGLARLLNEVPAGSYSIHFLVYDDSFPAFLNARQVPLGRGYDTGWEFLPEGKAVVFSSRGTAPPAL